MAYQKVGGTPRFYIDHMQYLKNINFDFEKWYEDYYTRDVPTHGDSRTTLADPEIFTLDPAIQKHIINEASPDEADYIYWDLPTAFLQDFEIEQSDNLGLYAAFLNHNMNDRDIQFFITYRDEVTNFHTLTITMQEIINYGTTGTAKALNGFSIIEPLVNVPKEYKFFRYGIRETDNSLEANELGLGALSYGIYYDMPVSPDLDLSMEIEFDGVNNIKTLSGHTITQANYQGSPWWYDKDGNKVEPWSVGQSTGVSKRNGRRVWNLKFSYMSDKDLFASNYGSSNYGNTRSNYDSSDVFIPLSNILGSAGEFTSNSFQDGTAWTLTGSEAAIDTSAGTVRATSVRETDTVRDYINSMIAIQSLDIKVTIKVNSIDTTDSIKHSNFSQILVLNPGVHTHTKTYNKGSTYNSLMQNTGGNDNYITLDYYRIEILNDTGPPDTFFYHNIDNDDSFSAQVLNKISHGEKFIFQPDNTANNPSDFAICVLDGDSFSMKRTAWNVYDIEMKIKEVW